MDSLTKIVKLQKQLTNLEHEHWINNVLFSLNWWILLFLIIVPWIIWWKLVDRKRIKEILLYGFCIMIISSILDDIGIALSLWAYPYQLIQIMDRLNAVDLAVLPVIYMLIYQYFSRWNVFFMANILVSFLYAFAAEPILVWMGIYKVLTWKYIYSFPIYIIIGVVVKLFVDKINRI